MEGAIKLRKKLLISSHKALLHRHFSRAALNTGQQSYCNWSTRKANMVRCANTALRCFLPSP